MNIRSCLVSTQKDVNTHHFLMSVNLPSCLVCLLGFSLMIGRIACQSNSRRRVSCQNWSQKHSAQRHWFFPVPLYVIPQITVIPQSRDEKMTMAPSRLARKDSGQIITTQMDKTNTRADGSRKTVSTKWLINPSKSCFTVSTKFRNSPCWVRAHY